MGLWDLNPQLERQATSLVAAYQHYSRGVPERRVRQG
jgi:hypothetical protein